MFMNTLAPSRLPSRFVRLHVSSTEGPVTPDLLVESGRDPAGSGSMIPAPA
jgi:hypothetical protein